MTYPLDPTELDAVVFDFDGVILESAGIKTQAFLSLFADRPELHPQILAHHFENLGVSRFAKFEWIFSQILEEPLSAEEKKALGTRYSALVLDAVVACPGVPGAVELLTALRGVLPLFVASATPNAELEYILEARGLHRYFQTAYGSPPGKTDRLRQIVSEHSFNPKDVLMIGDGISDLQAARNCECRFLARSDSTSPRQPWPLGVDIVSSLEEIEII